MYTRKIAPWTTESSTPCLQPQSLLDYPSVTPPRHLGNPTLLHLLATITATDPTSNPDLQTVFPPWTSSPPSAKKAPVAAGVTSNGPTSNPPPTEKTISATHSWRRLVAGKGGVISAGMPRPTVPNKTKNRGRRLPRSERQEREKRRSSE